MDTGYSSLKCKLSKYTGKKADVVYNLFLNFEQSYAPCSYKIVFTTHELFGLIIDTNEEKELKILH